MTSSRYSLNHVATNFYEHAIVHLNVFGLVELRVRMPSCESKPPGFTIKYQCSYKKFLMKGLKIALFYLTSAGVTIVLAPLFFALRFNCFNFYQCRFGNTKSGCSFRKGNFSFFSPFQIVWFNWHWILCGAFCRGWVPPLQSSVN